MRMTEFYRNIMMYSAEGLLKQSSRGVFTVVGNRRQTTVKVGNEEIFFRITDLTQPGGYSREELVSMMELIRKEEERQGWKVPEAANNFNQNEYELRAALGTMLESWTNAGSKLKEFMTKDNPETAESYMRSIEQLYETAALARVVYQRTGR